MTKLIDCVEIINEKTFVLIKVKEGKTMDMIMTGLFDGNETMFRITKGKDHNCTTWYSDKPPFTWHHGIGGYTCVSNVTWDRWRAIEDMLKKAGINIERIDK